MNIKVILEQMLVLFFMMSIGYFLYKKKWIDNKTSEQLSKMVVSIFNPVLVLYGVSGKTRGEDYTLLLHNLVLSVIYFFLLTVVALVLIFILRPEKKDRNIYRLMTIFANVGFMGIPIISSVYGTEAIIYVVFYMLGYNLLLYTYGMIIARNAGIDADVIRAMENKNWKINAKKMINPGVVVSLFAVVIFFFQLPLPNVVVTFADYVGNATIPLSMILIGISIAKANLKSIFVNRKLYVFILLRMIVLPVVAFYLLKGLHIASMAIGIFVLQLSMPVGTVTVLLAKENGADETFCTDGIVLTTLLSLLTIPLVTLFTSM